MSTPIPGTVHHIELWVPDLDRAVDEWGWLLGELGYQPFQDWTGGRSWRLAHTYLVIEQSPDMTAAGHDRTHPGLNHLAFHAGDQARVDALAAAASGHGWNHLFAAAYPHAGGPDTYAAYLINTDGYEVELVADNDSSFLPDCDEFAPRARSTPMTASHWGEADDHQEPEMHQMIFVNLPIADTTRSREFFTKVGYSFDETMCQDGTALAVELGPNMYAMLLTHEFFNGFHDGTLAEPGQREVLTCVSANDKDHVNTIVDAAVEAGGREVRKQEAGDWMYGRSYADLDGHIWEVMWMDVEKATEAGAFG